MARPVSMLAIASLATAALASGCADDDTRVLIIHNQVPGDGCLISATESDAFISNGIADTSADSLTGYLFTPLIKNFTVVPDDVNESQRIAFLHGARVEITFADTVISDATIANLESQNLTRFSVPFAASVSPAGGTAGLGFEIIPKPLLDGIKGELGGNVTLLKVRVQVFGDMGGGDVESQWFDYPVTACNGCLVVDRGACAALPSGFTPRAGNACNPGQDSPVDCCDGICPAPSASGGN